MLKRQIQNTNIDQIKNVIDNCEYRDYELNNLLSTSILNKEWIDVAKIVSIIQFKPNTIFISNLCDLLNFHINEFHPEEVVDAVSEILELTITEDNCIQIIECLRKLLFRRTKGDPSLNTNIKILENLEWIVRLNMDSSKDALKLIEEASNYNNDIISDEAKECIDSLKSDGFL